MYFSHSPAFGFGHATKLESSKQSHSQSPGPGQYESKYKGKKNPEWKIGTSQRETFKTNQNPGVGQYSLPNNFPSGPKYTISTKPNFLNINKFNTPGPGQYKTLKKSSSAYYTMASKLNNNMFQTEKTPGPGNYNVDRNKVLRKSPSFKFGSQKRLNLNNTYLMTPGPGNYDLKNTNFYKKPIYTFGKEKKGEIYDEKFPGPGQYNISENNFRSSPKITIAQKLNYNQIEGKKEDFPAPGLYNIQNSTDYILHKSPSFKIGTSKRNEIYSQKETPAPNQYNNNFNLNKKKNPSWKIGTGKRIDLNPNDKNIPGVGNYNISKGIELKKITIFGKGKDNNNDNYPGPGQYNNNNNNNLMKYPSWKIGTGSRDDNFNKVLKENYPGPGQYTLKDKDNKNKFTFGKEKKGELIDNGVPGPGYYHIPCSIIDVNDYTREQGKFDPYFRYI